MGAGDGTLHLYPEPSVNGIRVGGELLVRMERS